MSEPQTVHPDVDGPPRTARRSMHVPSDLTLYAALAGRTPDIDPTLADPLVAAGLAVRADPWSPAVLGAYVRQVVRAKGPRLNRPELAAWVRRQSDLARRRLTKTAGRVSAGAFTVGTRAAAADVDD